MEENKTVIYETGQDLKVNDKKYRVICLLGKGKGGYSYQVTDEKKEYVLKQIHHEPCSYYQFGNKIEAELRDYDRLKKIGIRMPKLLDVDIEKERILKEYICGDTIYDYVLYDEMRTEYLDQMQKMCPRLYQANTNIDYFPTNFVVQDELIYYIDYECNDYMEEWNFENWGFKYWSQTEEFLSYVQEHNTFAIRRTALEDRDDVMEIYRIAQEYMVKSGNPNQWAVGHPNWEMIKADIEKGQSYVCLAGGKICGVFAFILGEDPTYQIIEQGSWLNNAPYGTIHRIASDGTCHGVFASCIDFCRGKSKELRIDTHEDNKTMQYLIEKNGFVRCGIIHLANGAPRIAYQYEGQK